MKTWIFRLSRQEPESAKQTVISISIVGNNTNFFLGQSVVLSMRRIDITYPSWSSYLDQLTNRLNTKIQFEAESEVSIEEKLYDDL